MLCTYILHIHMYMCTYVYVYVYLHTHMSLSIFMRARSLQSCPTLCNRLGCRPSGFPVHGILQERILEWVAAPSFRDLPNPGIEPPSLMSPTLAVGFFTTATCLMMAVRQSQSRSRSQLTVLPMMKPSWLSRPNSTRDSCAEPAGLGAAGALCPTQSTLRMTTSVNRRSRTATESTPISARPGLVETASIMLSDSPT